MGHAAVRPTKLSGIRSCLPPQHGFVPGRTTGSSKASQTTGIDLSLVLPCWDQQLQIHTDSLGKAGLPAACAGSSRSAGASVPAPRPRRERSRRTRTAAASSRALHFQDILSTCTAHPLNKTISIHVCPGLEHAKSLHEINVCHQKPL